MDALVGYRQYTREDALTRAEKEREREINENAVDDMIRLESEFEDVISAAEALKQDGWYDFETVLKLVNEAKARTVKQRRLVEQHI